MGRHLIWDWNGTLLDDITLVVAACNDAFASVGGPVIDVDEHRRSFRRPIMDYYAEALRRPVDADEFARLDKIFHDSYRVALPECELREGVVDALTGWGPRQSLLSMWFHDELVPCVDGYGLTEFFQRIDGLRAEVGGDSKAASLAAHLGALGLAGADAVLIGDTVDDAHAAASVGAAVVLVGGGFTDAERLRAHGVPFAETIPEAVALAAAL
ncbi:phosphatase [Longispora fulva]|uniref:Phosphoglycolate phosphatase-like HAD superfamily hydrolase n=1 Tax=Longispora fulva TaxID=619741 RepID=A0A8J7GXN7_9ACTN|nr:HAD family hydrolase [Longispora fulva]MBG6139951.1 phosphoglycolate phosphatase-like HAD superfamily hydrolase [Longispora fulva]GIG57665.1 phosphatase [Longispora fulva]